jgi:hypothetical protein
VKVSIEIQAVFGRLALPGAIVEFVARRCKDRFVLRGKVHIADATTFSEPYSWLLYTLLRSIPRELRWTQGQKPCLGNADLFYVMNARSMTKS